MSTLNAIQYVPHINMNCDFLFLSFFSLSSIFSSKCRLKEGMEILIGIKVINDTRSIMLLLLGINRAYLRDMNNPRKWGLDLTISGALTILRASWPSGGGFDLFMIVL